MHRIRVDIENRRSDIEELIRRHTPKFEIARILDCGYRVLQDRLVKWGIAYAGNQSRKGRRHGSRHPLSYYLNLNGPKLGLTLLRKRLVEDGLRQAGCEKCLNTEWQGAVIPLEVHHLNGNYYDNRLENLQILCPNCHAQTPNHAGKGLRGRNALSLKSVDKAAGKSVETLCAVCSKAISSRRTWCKRCVPKTTKIAWPSLDVLLAIKAERRVEPFALSLGVSGNAVRKRIKRLIKFNGGMAESGKALVSKTSECR